MTEREEISLEEYAVIVAQAPIMIWRSGRDAKCDYFNDRWLAFTGRSLEQEAGDGWAKGVHADDLQRCLKIYLDAFEKRETFEMEYRLRRYDGVYRWIWDRGGPFKDSDGAFAGYIGGCVDVAERVEAQEMLQRIQELELRQLRGLLPICSHCKRIRDDANAWQAVESYVVARSRAQFSHVICPACQEKHYPGATSGA